jgi:hypothetical protein
VRHVRLTCLTSAFRLCNGARWVLHLELKSGMLVCTPGDPRRGGSVRNEVENRNQYFTI